MKFNVEKCIVIHFSRKNEERRFTMKGLGPWLFKIYIR